MVEYVSRTVSLVHLFLLAFQQPTVLVTHLCWSSHSLVLFNRQLVDEFNHLILIRHAKSQLEIDEMDSHHVLVVVDEACPGIEEAINQSVDKLNGFYRWLFIHTTDLSSTERKTMEIFGTTPVLQSNQIYFVSNYQEDEGSFELKRIYRNAAESELILESVLKGNFNDPTSVNWLTEFRSVAVSRLQSPGLSGALVHASLVITHNDSLNHLTDYANKHLDTISKVNYLLTNDIIVFMNASVQYSIVPSWGYLNNETGHWDGMIGQLVRGEAELGASPLFFTADRVGTIQYLSMTSPTKSKFVFQAPKLSYTENLFLLPFGMVSYKLLASESL